MAKILIAEDEALIRFALADALVDAGHIVIECANVLEAVAALSRHDDIEAVVTDIDMPGGPTGLALAGLVRATLPLIPVWVTSGRPVDLCGLDGVAFLPKPYDFAKLARNVTDRITRNGPKTKRRLPLPTARYRSFP